MFDDGRNRAKILCVAAVLAVLAATLWPFNPFERNGVTWLEGGTGLKFDGDSLVLGTAPLTVPESDADSYSIELSVRPATVEGSHTIFGVYSPGRPSELLVRQYFDGLLVTHDGRVFRDRTRTIKFDVDHIFSANKLVVLAISSGPDGTTVYADGRLVERIPTFKISRSELAGEIVLGTSPVTYHTWEGELHGLALYSRGLAAEDALRGYQDWSKSNATADLTSTLARYSFREGMGRTVRNEVSAGPSLEIPSTFSVPFKGFLRSPASEFRLDSMYAMDLLINILGFIPLGMIVCAYLLWSTIQARTVMLTTILCGSLSLLVEILQFYIPRRGSGITDVLTNTLGAAIGSLLLQTGPVRHILTQMSLTPKISGEVDSVGQETREIRAFSSLEMTPLRHQKSLGRFFWPLSQI